MKKFFLLTAVFCLMAVSALAQSKTDFSGTWTLDSGRSKLDERARIESITLTVAQTASDIKVETATKRLPPPADAPQGGTGRGGGRGGDGTSVYTLDGKETTIQQEGPMGSVPVRLTAKLDGGKLNLSRSSTINTPAGEVSISNKETWTLSEDGKTLTIEREMSSPRGTSSSTLVFTKKS